MSVTDEQVGVDHWWNSSERRKPSTLTEEGLIPSFTHSSHMAWPEIELISLK
jgi:hypothetical protein